MRSRHMLRSARSVASGSWGVFVLVTATYLVYLPTSGYDTFYYDAANYWALADQFGKPGNFDLLAFQSPLRGYSLPLMLRELQSISTNLGIGPVAAVRVANALMFALLGTQLLPRLFRRIFSEAQITPLRLIAFNALIFLFWRDYANFPLSDFPALTLMAGALLLATNGRWSLLPLSGLLAGLAVNVRPAYSFAALFMVALVAWRMRDRLTRGRVPAILASATLVVVGLAVALAPQVAINRDSYGTSSPFPYLNRTLSLFQLQTGLEFEKYETLTYPNGGVYFNDPGTFKTLRDKPITDYDQYVGIVARDPVAVGAGYVRRVFNGLDVQYTSPYIRDFDGDRSGVRSWLLYTLLFLALVGSVRGLGRTMGRVDWALLALFLLPVLSAITGAVEVRFMIAGAMLVYGIVCFANRRPLADLAPRWRPALICLYLLFVAGCFAAADQAYSHHSNAPVAVTPPVFDVPAPKGD